MNARRLLELMSRSDDPVLADEARESLADLRAGTEGWGHIEDAAKTERATREALEALSRVERERDEARAAVARWEEHYERETADMDAGEGDLAALREVLGEWISAHDAEASAAKHAARARAKQYAKWPARMPRNAVLVSSLPPAEQRRINEECACTLAPIRESEAQHKAARERLTVAIDLARALSAPSPSTEEK
jgi:hypothetical protein